MDTETRVKYYGQDKEIDQAVENYIKNEVLCNQSYLVDALLAVDPSVRHYSQWWDDMFKGFQYEEIENLYPDPEDWDIDECREYCEERGIDGDRVEDDVESWRKAIQESAEPAEVFEWWLVSPWLARELRALNEPILEPHEGYGAIWWGRTCTGQAIALDPTFYEIYARNH